MPWAKQKVQPGSALLLPVDNLRSGCFSHSAMTLDPEIKDCKHGSTTGTVRPAGANVRPGGQVERRARSVPGATHGMPMTLKQACSHPLLAYETMRGTEDTATSSQAPAHRLAACSGPVQQRVLIPRLHAGAARAAAHSAAMVPVPGNAMVPAWAPVMTAPGMPAHMHPRTR